MSQVRSPAATIPHVLVTSKDAVQADGTVSSELVAIASDSVLRQSMEMTMDIKQNDWGDTNDYDSAQSDSDRDSRLTTTDIDNQLLADAERADARRNSKPPSADTSREKAPLLTVAIDIDDLLFMEELDNIRAGVGRPDSYPAPTKSRELEQMASQQSIKAKMFWRPG
ncbi:hypothetical protein [Noviherbaspirillum pedocola]|uniref:Uncharacterized protein n=1 Tax=Noviherbaspirillum pedocola TaxID=2801341 RepID=A0A934SQ81_9BURK|nr:hypothetical protein [Noviherbaspirillum pedocola]MBK4734595.1 hypothetical protein [Noviherbaspirillum pedocola]